MTQGGRAVGGHLSVAERRIAFTPHGFDRATGGQGFDHSLNEIGSVDIAPRTFHPFDGGLSKRLRLNMRDGSEALFVVRRAAGLRDQIIRSVETGGGSSQSEA